MTDRRAMDADGGMCACGYPKPNCMHPQCIAGEQGADSEGYDEEEMLDCSPLTSMGFGHHTEWLVPKLTEKPWTG